MSYLVVGIVCASLGFGLGAWWAGRPQMDEFS